MHRTAKDKAGGPLGSPRGLPMPLRSSSDLRKRNPEIECLILVVIFPSV